MTVANSDESSVDDADQDADYESDLSEPLNLAGDRRLITQPYDYSIQQLVDEIGRRKIRLDVEYQRKYVWDDGKASRLIESLLLNVPIPVCYFAEDDDFNFEVIDGLQRITSLKRYLADEFALTGVTVLDEIQGRRFTELAPKDQRRLASRTLRCVAITADSNADIKFDVFERLNTNVAVLTPQELRNCVYRGDFNDSLKEFAASYAPLAAMVGSNGRKRMVAEELLLRFMSLKEQLSDYRPPLRQFLNTYMRSRRHNPVSDDERKIFVDCLDTALEVFGSGVFQVPDRSGAVHNVVNKALFDSVMISLAFADCAQIRAQRDALKDVVEKLLADDDFRLSLGRATADRRRVFARIQAFSSELADRGIESEALAIVAAEGR